VASRLSAHISILLRVYDSPSKKFSALELRSARAILASRKTGGISFSARGESMKAPVLKMTTKLRVVLEHATESAALYLNYEGKLLLALIEVERTKAYRCFGFTHLTTYCRKELNLSEEVAANFVRVVKKSIDVPELAQAVISGEVQLTKAKAIASVLTPENKREWIAKAASSTKLELEKDVMNANGRETKLLQLALTPEEHELLRRAQEVLCAKLDHYPTKEEACVWALNFTLDKIDPLRKADRSRERSQSPSIEDQVIFRDHNFCQAELPDGTICGEAKWVHHHHILPREFGGEDTPENLITLCASHHRMLHAEMDH
jgi:hypothetical protein